MRCGPLGASVAAIYSVIFTGLHIPVVQMNNPINYVLTVGPPTYYDGVPLAFFVMPLYAPFINYLKISTMLFVE
jgi:hypothetical protein